VPDFPETYSKNNALKIIISFMTIVLLAMSVVRYVNQQYIQLGVDIITVVVFTITYFFIDKKSENYNLASCILIGVGLITIISAQFENVRHVWFIAWMLLAFFLRGKIEGWFWFGVGSLSIAMLYFFAPSHAGMSTEGFYILLSVLLFVAFVADWYERHGDERLKDIRTINDTLEDTVDQRTKELDKARQKAEDALRARSEFLANMSHEIRTPLNAINGFISLMKEDEKDQKKQEYFEIIQHASYSLVETINDILDYSKLENNMMVLQESTFHLDTIMETIKLFKPKAKEKMIAFDFSVVDLGPYKLQGDLQKIKQVINNLLSNAIKFTPEKGVIRCDISYQNGYLFVSIKDSGVGISAEKTDTVFEPFVQENGSTSRQFGGTGLGLAIASSFVKLMGGTLQVESEVGKGSYFYFDIPLICIKDEPLKLLEEEQNANMLTGHILLAEDNKANQMFMGLMLSKMGLSYEVASDGAEAVEMRGKNDYTLILMDEHMPNMSGTEATIKILQMEKEEQREHIPIIALTANALTGDRERFLEAGMDDYISKPVETEEMLRLLKKYCKEEDV